MQLKLEQLEYQDKAIKSIIDIFAGQERNIYENACFEGIRFNHLSLSQEEIIENL